MRRLLPVIIVLVALPACGGQIPEDSQLKVEEVETHSTVVTTLTKTPEPTSTLSPRGTPTPSLTSTPTFKQLLGYQSLSPVGEDIRELATVLREAGVEVTIKTSDCDNMVEPFLILTAGSNCQALSEFMVENLETYDTSELFLIFEGEITLDDLHNPRVLHKGRIGNYTFFVVDVADLKYINQQMINYPHSVFVDKHSVMELTEQELRTSFTKPGREIVADKLAHNLFLGCSVFGDKESLETFDRVQNKVQNPDEFVELSLGNSFSLLVELGQLELGCSSEETILENLVGAFGVTRHVADAIGSSSLAVESSVEPIPTKIPLPFPANEGNETWQDFAEISSRIEEETGLVLRAEFGECRYPNTPWSELIVYNGESECWKIDSITSHGADDADPDTEETEYFAGLIVSMNSIAYISAETGEELDCVELEEFSGIPITGCLGRYGILSMYVPLPDYVPLWGSPMQYERLNEPLPVPQNAVGFDREAIEAFNRLDPWDGSNNPFSVSLDKKGIIGVDKETYLLLDKWLNLPGIPFPPFFKFSVEERELQNSPELIPQDITVTESEDGIEMSACELVFIFEGFGYKEHLKALMEEPCGVSLFNPEQPLGPSFSYTYNCDYLQACGSGEYKITAFGEESRIGVSKSAEWQR